MRALAQLSALAAALATTTLAYQQENAWSSTNTSPLGTTDELLALTDGAECAVPESFALTITMGKCFSPTEIAEVRNSLNWPVSNAKFKSKTLKTVSCSSTNESPYAMPSPLLRPPQIDIVMGKKKSTVRGAVIIRVCSSLDCGVLPTDIVVSSAAKAHSAISQTKRLLVCVHAEETNPSSMVNANVPGISLSLTTSANVPVISPWSTASANAPAINLSLTGNASALVTNLSLTVSASVPVTSCSSTASANAAAIKPSLMASAGVPAISCSLTAGASVPVTNPSSMVNANVPGISLSLTTSANVPVISPWLTASANAPAINLSLTGNANAPAINLSLTVSASVPVTSCSSTASANAAAIKPSLMASAGVPAISWSLTAEKAALKLKDDCKVDAPVPKDSYVNDGRKNQNDAAKIDPVISITATREGDTTGVTHKAPWIDYALTPQNLENKVTFGSFGVFDLSLTATDYRYEATCRGCVAVVDNYPPTAKDQCKTSDNQATKVLYSTSNLDDAIAEEAKFKAFYSPDNVINNGAYDSTTGANERCDESSASMQDFFETSASPLRSVESTCFDSDFVTELLDSTPKESPFLLSDVEMNALQCTRCCSKSLSLQEYYYAYDCSTKAAYTEKKTAISDSCSFGHCLQMSSNSLVTSTADITPEADAKTTKTVAGLPSPITPGIKDIHRSITCSSFDGGCSYTSKLGELFKHSSKWGVSVPDSYNVDDYVFWRYSVGTESWNSWDDSATLTFTEAQTDVFVEAWTHCGQVLHDTFTVFLHPHSSRPKCAGFNAMWSELTAYPRTVDSHMCAYPGSDFVLMQFAYDSEPNLPHDANTVQGKFTDVKCYVKLAASGSLASVTHGEVPLAITPDSNGRIQVSKQLALELVHDPETVENTDVQVECDFTLTHYDAATTETDTCLHSFTITDCDHTEIETYGAEAVCKAGECLSPSGTPGPFETCGGSVFTTENYVTQEKTLSGECCKECSNTLACTALAESNPGDGVQRCEPASTGDLLVMALRGEGEWKDAATPSMVLMFMGVTALVAVVALVVVKRRNAGAARATEEYDAYYPLLE
ncbi:hypothetical protein PC116_g1036 [Phytophthora cactorum]|uniref:Uncharacterized protein n=1 Tax=Phytophthora cactorum TaxID=29920 RepID=A0A8T1EIM7_9STRA|nr:hypothetical protein PC117_g3632 [Phytophthora cactorum]KAG4251329.1 hypothetical protein PC116_g1036 [Phytophthora cactorum]